MRETKYNIRLREDISNHYKHAYDKIFEECDNKKLHAHSTFGYVSPEEFEVLYSQRELTMLA